MLFIFLVINSVFTNYFLSFTEISIDKNFFRIYRIYYIKLEDIVNSESLSMQN